MTIFHLSHPANKQWNRLSTGFSSPAQPRWIDAMLSVVFAYLRRGGPPLFIATPFPCGRSVWAEHKPQRSVYMLNITVA